MKKSLIFIILSVFLLASCNLITDGDNPSFKVYHYLENLEDDEFTLNSKLTQKLKGKIGEETSVEPLALEGFTPQDFGQIILAQKNNSISIYYKRNVSKVTFNGNGGFVITTNDEGEEESLNQIVITGKYGTPIEEPVFTRNAFISEGWDKELPQTIPASDIELTVCWKADITNKTYRYFVRPVQKFVISSGSEFKGRLCWDYQGSLSVGQQIIIWQQKSSDNIYNQIFSFEPVNDKENTYYIFSQLSGAVFYLAENTKEYKDKNINRTVSINGLCAAYKSAKSLQFELIPVKSSVNPNEEVFAFKISGTDRYVTCGYSLYKYYEQPSYMVCYGGYEPFLIFDTLRTDENGNIDPSQLFYLDNVD